MATVFKPIFLSDRYVLAGTAPGVQSDGTFEGRFQSEARVLQS